MFNVYTQSFNKQQNRHGSLFARPYNRKKITSEDYLLNTINYIHQNPVSHEYVAELDDWKYSSYPSFFSKGKTNISKNEVIELFNDIDNFKYYHDIKKANKFSLDMGLLY